MGDCSLRWQITKPTGANPGTKRRFDVENDVSGVENDVFDIENAVFNVENDVSNTENDVFDVENVIFDIENVVLDVENDGYFSKRSGRNTKEIRCTGQIRAEAP